MLKVENKSKAEIAKIGRKIGEAFSAEKGEGYLAYAAWNHNSQD